MVDKGSKPRRRRGRNNKSSDHPSNNDNEISSFASKSTAPSTSAENFKAHKSLLIHLTEETPTWYDCGRHTSGRDDTIYTHPLTAAISSSSTTSMVQDYRALADSVFQTEMQLFSSSNGSAEKDEKWVESTMKRGTLKDRIAAMSVVVSQNPVHKLYALDGLLQLAGCSVESKQTNSRVAQMAADALFDLFVNTLLPTHRKLYSLDQRPLHLYATATTNNSNDTTTTTTTTATTSKTLSPRILLLWRYEEVLKQKYQLFIRHYLEYTLNHHSGATTGGGNKNNTSNTAAGGSNVEMTKLFALRTCSSLLQQVPEQEAHLLSIVVNKLGDPMKKIAASAGHELRQMLKHHPMMKVVIAREVQQLSYRPQLSPRALYNCIIFLNQLQLEKGEGEETDKGDSNDKDKDDDKQNKKNNKKSTSLPASLINTYFRLFEVAVQQPHGKHGKKHPQDNSNDHNNSMKSRLLSAILTGVNRAHPYLPQKDQQMEQHIDTLYRIVHTSSPATCTQALMLLFHLAVGSNDNSNSSIKASTATNKVTKSRQDRFYRALYSTLGAGGTNSSLVSSGKHLTLYFNLLYKAMKYDTDQVRVIALAKRLLCSTLNCGSAPVLAGSIFLVNEVMKYHPSLKAALHETYNSTSSNNDENDNSNDDDGIVMLDPTKREPHGALVRFTENGHTQKTSPSEILPPPTSVPLWEVSLVSHHYHPSVSKFAHTMGGTISYGGDPLKDFGLVPFLDKFAYRNPKKNSLAGTDGSGDPSSNRRGESIAERRFASSVGQTKQERMTVNDPKKQKWDESEEFFQTFFTERARRDEIKGIVRHKSQEDDDNEKAAFEEADGTMEAANKIDFDTQFDDTDSEEEEFVNKLAENLMASSANARGGNTGDKAHYDDEDPDMDGWSDLDSDDGKEKGDEAEMDAALLNDEEEDSDVDVDPGHTNDDDDFMDAAQDDSDSEEGGNGGNFVKDESDDDEDDLALIEDEQDEDDEIEDEIHSGKKKHASSSINKKKKQTLTESFVDASDYEEIINKAWEERKRPASKATFDDTHADGEDDIGKAQQAKKKQKKKNKKRRKH